jgi:hypothetical protein
MEVNVKSLLVGLALIFGSAVGVAQERNCSCNESPTGPSRVAAGNVFKLKVGVCYAQRDGYIGKVVARIPDCRQDSFVSIVAYTLRGHSSKYSASTLSEDGSYFSDKAQSNYDFVTEVKCPDDLKNIDK